MALNVSVIATKPPGRTTCGLGPRTSDEAVGPSEYIWEGWGTCFILATNWIRWRFEGSAADVSEVAAACQG